MERLNNMDALSVVTDQLDLGFQSLFSRYCVHSD